MRLASLHSARGLALGLAVLMGLLSFQPWALGALDWSRAAILQGQWYRLFTAHLMHLNATHLVMNLAALLLLAELFWHDLPARKVAALLALSALGVGLGLMWLAPDLWRYAGLSGVLHGAWAGSALLLLQEESTHDASARTWWACALLALAAKLLMENFVGLKLAASAIGAPVVLQSHALGAACGSLFAGLVWMAKRLGRTAPGVASHPVFD